MASADRLLGSTENHADLAMASAIHVRRQGGTNYRRSLLYQDRTRSRQRGRKTVWLLETHQLKE